MANSVITLDDVPNVLEKLETRFFDIPFENSAFQTQAFVIAAQQTPARAYRAIGLRAFNRVQAVKGYMISKERTKIDIEEKEAKIADPETSEFDRRRLRLDIIEIREGEKYSEKLLNDALTELNLLNAELAKYPEYTRAQFEAEEPAHFEAKLTRQLNAPGAHEALANMRNDLPGFDKVIALAASHIPALEEKAR